jgi:hypothetical protein
MDPVTPLRSVQDDRGSGGDVRFCHAERSEESIPMDASPGDAGLRMTAEDAAPDCEGVGTLVSGVSNLNSRAFITMPRSEKGLW